MKVAIGNDHHGVELKNLLVSQLEQSGHTVINAGTDTSDAVDYPDVASEVAEMVSVNEVDRGILICGSGQGMAIVANKFQGVRAAVCLDQRTAEVSRQHNDANVICLSGQGGVVVENSRELFRSGWKRSSRAVATNVALQKSPRSKPRETLGGTNNGRDDSANDKSPEHSHWRLACGANWAAGKPLANTIPELRIGGPRRIYLVAAFNN